MTEDLDLATYGWTDRWAALAAARGDDTRPGRVLRADGPSVLVASATGVASHPLRGTAPAVTVGDWVVVDGAGAVADVLDRTSLLRRASPSGEEQLLAANVDVVGIVLGLDRPVKLGRIRRTVALTWDAGASPVVVLTKADLTDPAEAVAAIAADDPLLEVHTVSAVSGAGMEALRDALAGRTAVLLGESGAGKSTLTNLLVGRDVADVGHVRAGDRKGRHTTTARLLHPLGGGTCLIDTPGIRAVGLWTDVEAVDEVFDDIEALARDCRFGDCRHDTEPGCAVRAAVAAGELAEARLAAWRELRAEAEAAALRADEAAYRREGRRFGRMVREVQRLKRDQG